MRIHSPTDTISCDFPGYSGTAALCFATHIRRRPGSFFGLLSSPSPIFHYDGSWGLDLRDVVFSSLIGTTGSKS